MRVQEEHGCMVEIKRSMSYKSLYWFLEEPLINGARLEFRGHTTLWLMLGLQQRID